MQFSPILQRTLRPTIVIDYAIIGIQFLSLLLLLKINRKIEFVAPGLWILVPILLSFVLFRAQFNKIDKSVVRLWQFVGFLSAVYSLLHYPLIPLPSHDAQSVALYALLLLFWGASVAGGVLCFWIPSLSLLAPSFLLWVNTIAWSLSGIRYTSDIDVLPLTEVAMCIGLGLLVGQIDIRPIQSLIKGSFERLFGALPSGNHTKPEFGGLLLIVAISVHLANYFWSFIAKMSLIGPFGAWLTENNPTYIFLAALDDGHIIFSGYPRLVEIAFNIFNSSYIFTNFFVLLFQAAAVAAFFLPKRWFVFLLIMFDVMHLSIIAIAGANFWPWIMLNLAIAFIVAKPSVGKQPLALRLAATAFIVVAPHFVHITKLGWFDSGVNNKLFFVAVDHNGDRYPVPENFFTFYSYPIAHMDYGPPDRALSFPVLSPHGGTVDYRIFTAGRACDSQTLLKSHAPQAFWGEKLANFIRNYHRMALAIYRTIGVFPYDLYPHHFYVPFSASEAFYKLDKQTIVAYIYRQETVCLSFNVGQLQRKVVGSAEFRIDISHANSVSKR